MHKRNRPQSGRNRAAAIVVAKGHVLLMERQRPGTSIYYVFPGGEVEKHETPRTAAQRELHEETGLRGRVIKRVITSRTISGGRQDYFLVQAPFLPVAVPRAAPERSPAYRQSRGLTRPVWIPISSIFRLRIFPPEMRRVLRRFLHDGFPASVVNLGTVGFREKVLRTSKQNEQLARAAR
ncbi:MAG: NUDIX domain-containing protein [Candidatus Kerfeldbacteria bacterium]|nr:NUDIX domain-containing protein [Candidatus Kerfeldbacteria bacterium]